MKFKDFKDKFATNKNSSSICINLKNLYYDQDCSKTQRKCLNYLLIMYKFVKFILIFTHHPRNAVFLILPFNPIRPIKHSKEFLFMFEWSSGDSNKLMNKIMIVLA